MDNGCSIGILGGSFDPVHRVHMAIAEAAARRLRLDKILLVPAFQAALKSESVCASDAHRLRMLEIAAAKMAAKCEIDTCELLRGGVSYSIDTARYLRAKYPTARLVWIIGSDHIGKLSRWRDIDELCEIVEFACAARPNCPTTAADLPKTARITFVKTELSDVSSSEIRERIRLGKNTDSMLDSDVALYINENKLYKI